METNYLIHYGIPKRSGRYPWGSGKRPFQSREEKRAARAQRKEIRRDKKADRINRRAEKKFGKIESAREESQRDADKYFDKAVKRSNRRFFSSQNWTNKAVERAYSSQQEVNRLEQKGKRYYQKIQKKMAKIDRQINPEIQKLGETYVQRTLENSKAVYNAILVSTQTGIRYRR